MTLQEIAEEVDMPLSTVARVSQMSQMRKTGNEPETEAEPEIESLEAARILSSSVPMARLSHVSLLLSRLMSHFFLSVIGPAKAAACP